MEEIQIKNATPTAKKVKMEGTENQRLVSLILIPEKVMKQINLENASKQMRGNRRIGRSQHGFVKGKNA